MIYARHRLHVSQSALHAGHNIGVEGTDKLEQANHNGETVGRCEPAFDSDSERVPYRRGCCLHALLMDRNFV